MSGKLELIRLLEQRQAWRDHNLLRTIYPESGKLSRHAYPKHMACFAAGARNRTRLVCGSNRSGKTLGIGAYETTLHLTGLYPDWWDGMRFNRPVICWAAGDTGKTTREFVQSALFGKPGRLGTGMIPADLIVRSTAKSGIADAIDTGFIKHKSGTQSICVLKSYDQGIDAFMGDAVHFVWLDEEPPLNIVSESAIRTMTVAGRQLITFMPIKGLTLTVQHFMPGGVVPEPQVDGRHVTQITWEDAPHLSDESKAELAALMPPHERDARMRGIPFLGAGAIYPVPESDIVVEPFEIPAHWRRCYGMDVGWNRTAAVWGAINPDTDEVVLYHEYYRGEAEPSIHAAGIRAAGDWIPGVIDPAARGRGQSDGRQLLQSYKDLGLDVEIADNGVESGIYAVWEALSTNRLRIFSTMRNWRTEYRSYRRDEKGKVVKENDHLMDATRYLMMSGLQRAKVCEPKRKLSIYDSVEAMPRPAGNMGWM